MIGATAVLLPQYCVNVLTGQEELDGVIGDIGVLAELVVFMYEVLLMLVEFILVVILLYEVVDGMYAFMVVALIGLLYE